MYERGILDAEHEELNLFYYQHYYHYRRGYDTGRKRIYQASGRAILSLRNLLILGGGVVVVVVVASIIIFFPVISSSGQRYNAAMVATTPTKTTRPTPRARATATATPAPATPVTAAALQVGGRAAVVNVGDSPLRGRREPGINQPVDARFPQASEVTILEGPVIADGYTWWLVESDAGKGWSAERSAEGVLWLEAVSP